MSNPRAAPDSTVLRSAALHSLTWLFVANLIGLWLAFLLLFPVAGSWLGEWTYGRWMPVHLNLQLYGWTSLPLVAWLFKLYQADRAPFTNWSRAGLWLWTLSLIFGSISWLKGHSSGKLFLDWSGFPRIFFPLSIFFLWCVLTASFVHSWNAPENLRPAARILKSIGLILLLLVPFVLYWAADPSLYPPVNPDSGGPTGASQLESSLIIVLILLLLPYGIVRRKTRGRSWLIASWLIFLAESILCVSLGRGDVSHHLPIQYLSLGTLLVWAVLIPGYFSTFQWPRNSRPWRMAVLAWWALLVVAGWWLFLPGVLDHLKFTDGLVGHSLMAMAGFVTSLLILLLVVLLGPDGELFNSRWAFIAWNGGTLAYVLLMAGAGWLEGNDPTFTILPGSGRNLFYIFRLLSGIAMTAASAHWLLRLSLRERSTSRIPTSVDNAWGPIPIGHPEAQTR